MSNAPAIDEAVPVRQGYSNNPHPAQAVAEFAERVRLPSMAAVVFFCSPSFDREVLASELQRQFPATPVLGCTTAGEINEDGYTEGSITGFSLSAPEFEVSWTLIGNLKDLEIKHVSEQMRRALETFNTERVPTTSLAKTVFGMLLIDGMSEQEEAVISALNSVIDPIPLFGGSAGDGLDFGSTHIYCDGTFHENAAVLTLVRTTYAFRVFKFDHFHPTAQKMVVTEADPNRRLVSEINAERAAPEYARILGLDEHQLNPMVFAAYPVMVRVGGEYHARSIQKAEENGSLRFYCAIDEGLVLTVAEGQEMSRSLDRALEKLKKELGPVQLILGFDCILRRLEAEQKQHKHVISETLKKHKVVGFNTYGEQYRSMHMNQTFTGVAISSSPNSAQSKPE